MRSSPATPVQKRSAPAEDDEDFSTLDTPPPSSKRHEYEQGFPVEVIDMTYNNTPTGNWGLKLDPTRKFNRKPGAGHPGFNNNHAVETALATASLNRPVKYNQHVGALLMRLTATGGREQLDKCLAAITDQKTIGPKLAALMTFRETPALEAFLAADRQPLYFWTDIGTAYVGGKVATVALTYFFKQKFDFTPDEQGIWSQICEGEDAQEALKERVRKLATTWGFAFTLGAPEDERF